MCLNNNTTKSEISKGGFVNKLLEGRIIVIDDLDDSRLAPFWNLRERTLRGESIFIAEGSLVVERLLKSQYDVESILVTHKESGYGDCFNHIGDNIPIYYVEDRKIVNKILGFEFHQGILALGRRKRLPSFREGLENWGENQYKGRHTWVILPEVTKPDNLGLVFRCAAALGAEAVVLGEKCCDPFSRRALRVSMGGVLQVPIFHSFNLLEEIKEIKKRWKIPFYATVLDDDALSLYELANNESRGNLAAFVFGNEYSGLTPEQVKMCDEKIIIPMRPDIDSLNLGVSVGIFLYEFNRGV